MKEATGELNMTVVTVVAIAAVGAFFSLLIWPAIQNSILQSTYCASAFNCDENGDFLECQYHHPDDAADVTRDISCPTNEVD